MLSLLDAGRTRAGSGGAHRASLSSIFMRKVSQHGRRIRDLLALFFKISRRTRAFQKKTGLSCRVRCGACCESPHIEATVLEMLPLAEVLIRNGEAEALCSRVEALGDDGRCVFFLPSPSDQEPGCCRAYPLRPLICRLFAFAGNRDKRGHVRLVTCRVIRKAQPVLAEKALSDVASGRIMPPILADWVMRASSIDPELSRESLPINIALRNAIERSWLYAANSLFSQNRSASLSSCPLTNDREPPIL
ncbi:MAG: YkgJ family cysteine cluster protein [Elusimicrobiota bacterium]